VSVSVQTSSFSGIADDGLLDRLIETLWTQGGTDLHLTAGSPPLIRLDGELGPVKEMPALSADDVERLIVPLLTADQLAARKALREIDFSFSWRERARLRGNVYSQRGLPALALRIIPHEIPTTAELGLPAAVERFAALKQGLVLVTGPTGSGKSTTLASLIDAINRERACHILTIEDPIEYVHNHRRAMVNQREVGLDSASFADALRSALREDPDVILVGEMRDLESIHFALTLAETGHLVFATLHTNDTSQAIDRLIDVFPADRQAQIPSPAWSTSDSSRASRGEWSPRMRFWSPPHRFATSSRKARRTSCATAWSLAAEKAC
jgi:twitching motility protein PilT